MSQIVFSLKLVLLLTFVSSSRTQERPPHGLGYENPVAFSPSAYDFFHPDAGRSASTKNPCSESGCSPWPLAAHFESNKAHESDGSSSSQRQGELGAGAIAAIVSGFVFAGLLGMCTYYVAITRQANMNRANSNQSDV